MFPLLLISDKLGHMMQSVRHELVCSRTESHTDSQMHAYGVTSPKKKEKNMNYVLY